MKPLVLTAAFVLVAGAPAWAQSTTPDMPGMPGMQHPGPHPPPLPPAPAPHQHHPAAPAPETPAPQVQTPEPAQPSQDGEAMPGMAMEEEVGDEPAPPAPTDFAADRVFDPAVMRDARNQLRREHGGAIISKVMLNLGEYHFRDGDSGYRWEGEAWIGGDIHRLVLKSEGEGGEHGGVEAGEVQALYSRAISPYFDLQVGVRHDFEPHPNRNYATVGVEGLAPYWFEVNGALFLSDRGELLGRLEGTYDLRLTQRLILQPRAEMNLAAQDIAGIGVGSGVSNLELGLRLRYEVRREFAPYVGVSFDRMFGDTADFARSRGDDPSQASVVFGIRAWF